MLAEGESKRQYHRKRLAQGFTTPQSGTPPKRHESHSPDFDEVHWDKGRLEETLRNWPQNTLINWSAVAREHLVPGKNVGQAVKEFAFSKDIHISTSGTPQRSRSSKRRLPGGEVSVPTNPSLQELNTQITSMIISGQFTLEQQCAPYQLTRYIHDNGKLTSKEITICGRKLPLIEIRKRLLEKHSQHMHLAN